MISFNRYKDGKKFIVTFSYDDGAVEDKRLIDLFNRYGVKGSFHLNSKKYKNLSGEQLSEIKKMYEGHEISCHTYNHCWPTRVPKTTLVNEVIDDRRKLEDIAEYTVCGMSYPFGDYNEEVISALNECGILYSRTTKNTKKFSLPENFLEWHPTTHHDGAMECAKRFIEKMSSKYNNDPLLYIWGHSFEFKTEEKWQFIEDVIKLLSENKEDIWFATNMEIYDYITALKNLRVAANEKSVYNPSAIPLWIEKDGEVFEIPAGKTVNF